jgi:uncharacterized membrane protein YedE/YeeE
MNSAFRDILVLKEYTLLKAVALALLGQLIAFHVLDLLEIITLNPKPLAWGGNILGGFLFGIGMALAAGCASGTTYRVGEGMVGSLMALLGLSLGAYTTGVGILLNLKNDLRADTTISADDGSALTLGNILGSDLADILTWVIVIVIAALGIGLIVWKLYLPWKEEGGKLDFTNLPDKIFKQGWKWWVTGTAIAVIGVLAFISSAEAGRNYPLGITAGWLGFLKYFVSGTDPAEAALSWIVFLVLGAVIGAFIAAIIANEFKFRAPKDGKILFGQFIGGLMMGIGAVFAAGCNIGNLLSGVPQLSVGSIVTSVFIILGTWIASYLLFMRD